MIGAELEALGWDDAALALVAQRGWTAEAIERLRLAWLPDQQRVGIPIRDGSGELYGALRYDPTGTHNPKVLAPNGVPRELFPAPETVTDEEVSDQVVALVEGEGDAILAWSLGLPAFGVPGAQNWRDEWAPRLAGRGWHVLVCFDCDGPGRANAQRAAAAITNAGGDACLFDLAPDRSDGYDLTDWARGRENSGRALLDAAASLGPYQPPEDDPTATFGEFVARPDDAMREPAIACSEGSALPLGGLALIAAVVGHGKTTLAAVELVLHAGAGRDYLGFTFPRPLRVLVIENEGPREAFRQKLDARLASWEHGGQPRIWDDPDRWGAVRISDKALRQQLRAVIERHRIDLVVSDSLTRFGVRGNGTPEETREFVEWLTELGLGRDVAFLLLHHPLTRPNPGESELERLAGAWHPHADLIMLLTRLGDGRARLSFPKTRWTKGTLPPWILGFDRATESFDYVGIDEAEQRDYVAELAELLADGVPRTVNALRKPKNEGGVGADPELIKQALADDRFASVSGDKIDKRKDWTYYVLRPASSPPDDGHDATTLLPEGGQRRPSSPRERELGDDDDDDVPGSDASRDDATDPDDDCGDLF